jgi:hypothetical protein
MENWVSVYISKDRIRAELIKNELISNDINAVILNKVDASYPVLGTVQINVPENQAELAYKCIDDLNLDDREP